MQFFFPSYSLQDQMNKHNLIIGMFRDKSIWEVKREKGGGGKYASREIIKTNELARSYFISILSHNIVMVWTV